MAKLLACGYAPLSMPVSKIPPEISGSNPVYFVKVKAFLACA
jgi:hypothetical protein